LVAHYRALTYNQAQGEYDSAIAWKTQLRAGPLASRVGKQFRVFKQR